MSFVKSGYAIALHLDRDNDITLDDAITSAEPLLKTTDHFEPTLMWVDESADLLGRRYDIKLARQWVTASITFIKRDRLSATPILESCRKLELNTIAACIIAIVWIVVFETYEKSHEMGRFILEDRINEAIIACGVISQTTLGAHNMFIKNQ